MKQIKLIGILSLLVLLFGGFNFLSANSHKNVSFHYKVPTASLHVKSTIIVDLLNVDQHLNITFNGVERTYNQLLIQLFEKQENDDSISFKKHFKNNCHPASAFLNKTGTSFEISKSNFSLHPYYVSKFPSSLYLTLGVFRI